MRCGRGVAARAGVEDRIDIPPDCHKSGAIKYWWLEAL